MARDYSAEYARRKARAAAEKSTVYKRRNAAAKRLGYGGYNDLRARRRRGDLTPLDTARRAPIVGVTDIGGDRFTFRADTIDPMSRAELGRAVRQAKGSPLEMRATATVDWKLPDGTVGTASAGGAYGFDVDRIEGDAFDGIVDELELSYGRGVAFPANAQIVAISVFFFPVGEAA